MFAREGGMQTALNLVRDGAFRRWYCASRWRSVRMYVKYNRAELLERVGLTLLLFALISLPLSLRAVRAVLRMPTEDVNELLKQSEWRQYRSEADARKEAANRLLAQRQRASDE